MDYSKGKIYKIYDPHTENSMVYIGSTIQDLHVRFIKHKNDKRPNKAITSRQIFDTYDTVVIELIEEYPCETMEQLLWREREIIEQTSNCVNKIRPIISTEEKRRQWAACSKKYRESLGDEYRAYSRDRKRR